MLYVCAEDDIGCRLRIQAYMNEHGISELDVDVMEEGPDLMTRKDIKVFIDAVKAAGEYALIVIDTYAACMSGDENSGKDVGRALSHCSAIHRATGSTILLIHHSPKNGGSARGHSSLKAACDFELEVSRDEDRRMLSVTKMKHGSEDVDVGFRLK